jgi:hypothetical protein
VERHYPARPNREFWFPIEQKWWCVGASNRKWFCLFGWFSRIFGSFVGIFIIKISNPFVYIFVIKIGGSIVCKLFFD